MSAAITRLMSLHPDVQDLLDALRALEGSLMGHDDFWALEVGRAADEVADSNAHGLRRFMGLFGGMGSLNDVVLQRDGRPLGPENDQLAVSRERAWTLADRLRKDLKLSGAL